jgi:competence protein ComGF
MFNVRFSSLRIGLLAVIAMLAFSEPKETKTQSPSDTRQQVWAIRFAQLVKEPRGWTAVERHETQALAFSPDDKWLAVTLTHDQQVSERNFLFKYAPFRC